MHEGVRQESRGLSCLHPPFLRPYSPSMETPTTPVDALRIREGFTSQRLVRRSAEWRRSALAAPISREFCLTDIGHFPETRFHWVDRRAGTSEHILIYNRTGTGRAFIGDRSWMVPPEHVLLIPRDVAHTYGADESVPWSIYWFHFSGHSSDQIFELLQVSADSPLLSVGRLEGLLPLFETTLEMAARYPDPAQAARLSQQLLLVATTLRRAVGDNDSPAPRIDPRIEAAMNFMRRHLDRNCSLEEIARHVGLSVPQFSNLFRVHAGTSPLRFFTRWRMQRAAQRLERTDEPISTIAETLGYEDSFYFCRVFRQHVGLSPRQYRQQLRAGKMEGAQQ